MNHRLTTRFADGRRQVRRCFTLVEVMVVILIIGMILGLVGPFVMGQFNKAKRENARNQIKLLEQCVDTYYLDMQKLPNDLGDLTNNPGAGDKWQGPYIKDGIVPKDPWGHEYQYQSPGQNGREYDIYSYGADNAPGGDGNAADVFAYEEQS